MRKYALSVVMPFQTPRPFFRPVLTSKPHLLSRRAFAPMHAAHAQPKSTAAPVGRELVTNCTKCGAQFRWIDRPTDEEPFCPNCGYDTIYDGRRTAIDPGSQPQGAILPPKPTGFARCDKCGSTNRSTGHPMEMMIGFQLYRCSRCNKTCCHDDGASPFWATYGNETCPNCGELANFSEEEHRYI